MKKTLLKGKIVSMKYVISTGFVVPSHIIKLSKCFGIMCTCIIQSLILLLY